MAEPSFIDQSKLRFREGEIIFRKGEMAQQMYVILSGRVRLYVSEEPTGDWAEELAKGDFFGEGSLLERALHGLIATSVFVGLVLFAVARSKRLSDFLEALSDERLTLAGKLRALGGVVVNKTR